MKKRNSIVKNKLFLMIFSVPSILWIIMSIIELVTDNNDPEPLTLSDVVIADIVAILMWLGILYFIFYIINKFSKKNNDNSLKEEEKNEDVITVTKEETESNYLYKVQSIVDAYEYKRMAKYFPKRMYWAFVLEGTIFNLIITAIIGLITKSIILALYFLLIRQIYTMGMYSAMLEYFAEKVFDKRKKKYKLDTNVETEFYDTYFIRKDNNSLVIMNYSDIAKCVETDTNFYLEYPPKNMIIIIQKNACNLEIIDFIRSKFPNIENKLGDEIKFKEHMKPKTIKIFMLVLFIATILSFYFAVGALTLVNSLMHMRYLSLFKNLWVLWCFVPIPLASIILGYKYRNLGFKCTKNIVAGFIVGFILVVYGSFFLIIPSYKADYSKINDYKEYMDAIIPSNGDLEIIDYDKYYEEDKTNYRTINAYYDKVDTTKLEESIEDSTNWLKASEVITNLKIFMPVNYNNENVYYLVYNKTTGEYNTVPDKSGKYDIYTMMYDKKLKMLVIHAYSYFYR